MPGITFMIVTSDWLVALFLGPGWEPAARIFGVLGIAALIQPIGSAVGWLFITQARTREMFRWGVASTIITVLSFVAGLPWGALGVAAAYAATGITMRTPLLFWYVGRSGPVRARELYSSVALGLSAAAGVALVCIAVRQAGLASSAAVNLVISLPLATATAAVVYSLIPSGREGWANFAALIRLGTA
jgi:PST family polysaccharide transporter